MVDIEVGTNGPYEVHGLPLIRMRFVASDDTSKQQWVEREAIDTSSEANADGTYWLCRCGQSANKPFCDGSHRRVGFQGEETAAKGAYRERAKVMKGVGVTVRDVRPLCSHVGFCTADGTNVWEMVKSDDDSEGGVLATMVEMIDRCPSGALTHASTTDAPHDDEQRLPLRVAVCDDGPLFVTGGAAVVGGDGTAYEVRNRMTLCRCGASAKKPFCDGAHANPEVAFTDS